MWRHGSIDTILDWKWNWWCQLLSSRSEDRIVDRSWKDSNLVITRSIEHDRNKCHLIDYGNLIFFPESSSSVIFFGYHCPRVMIHVFFSSSMNWLYKQIESSFNTLKVSIRYRIDLQHISPRWEISTKDRKESHETVFFMDSFSLQEFWIAWTQT